METFLRGACVIGIIIVVIKIITSISVAVKKSLKERKERERARQERISYCRNRITNYENDFNNTITGFFTNTGSGAITYEGRYSYLLQIIDNIRNENKKLAKESAPREEALVTQLLLRADQFKQFGASVNNSVFKTMFVPTEYGKINKTYWDEVCGLNSSEIDMYVNLYNSWLKGGETDKLKSIKPTSIPAYVWFYATEKPYSASKFKTARDTFFYMFKGTFADMEVAEFFAIKQMGGEDVLKDRVRELLKRNIYNSDELTMIASGLMWMNAYQEENMVLQHMLSTGKQMTPKTQERLHSLSNGGGKAPSGYNVKSSADKIFFDVSSLAWKDEEYTGLFENLSFQDKTLSYSLAVRDEDKDLFLTKGIRVPDINELLQNINKVFSEEYGNTVTASLRKCVALSGSGQEDMEGIFVESQECTQMGLLVHIICIGKKLNIKFYTLFMPRGTSLMNQKQQALSLYNKLSPSVTMWEKSMKDEILMAIQQSLNAASQGPTSDTPGQKTNDEDPIF